MIGFKKFYLFSLALKTFIDTSTIKKTFKSIKYKVNPEKTSAMSEKIRYLDKNEHKIEKNNTVGTKKNEKVDSTCLDSSKDVLLYSDINSTNHSIGNKPDSKILFGIETKNKTTSIFLKKLKEEKNKNPKIPVSSSLIKRMTIFLEEDNFDHVGKKE